jgi:hypothetical protein
MPVATEADFVEAVGKSHRSDFPDALSRNYLARRWISWHVGKNATLRHKEGGGKVVCLLFLLSAVWDAVLAMQNEVAQFVCSIEPAALGSLHCVEEDEGFTFPPEGKGVNFYALLC